MCHTHSWPQQSSCRSIHICYNGLRCTKRSLMSWIVIPKEGWARVALLRKVSVQTTFWLPYNPQTKMGLILRSTVLNVLNYSLQKKYNPPLECQVALFYCFTPNTSNAILLETCKGPLSICFWYYLTWFSILTNISFSNWISSWLTKSKTSKVQISTAWTHWKSWRKGKHFTFENYQKHYNEMLFSAISMSTLGVSMSPINSKQIYRSLTGNFIDFYLLFTFTLFTLHFPCYLCSVPTNTHSEYSSYLPHSKQIWLKDLWPRPFVWVTLRSIVC